ncbi:MAG TPA: hypothetical protein VJ841_04785 [Candidatus Saccharimonadales bacterium]|nr:hypothetical protein [Candidatus Saccharimonadales bacterium]
MNKKALLITAGSVVVVAILGYLFLVPHFQVNAYANTVGEKQTKMNEALNKVGAILTRDTFVNTDVPPATVASDVKIGNEAIANAESVLQNSKSDLITFNTLPLLSVVNGRYKAAESLKADEQNYIAKYEAFLTEMKSVLAYQDKTSDISTKFSDFVTITSDAMLNAESPEEYSTKIDKGIATLQPSIDAFATLTPPASLKDDHDYMLKAFNDLVALYKQSSAAATSGNMDLYVDTLNKISEKYDEIQKKSDDFNAEFVRNSELQKLNAGLLDIDRKIIQKQASL